MGCRYPETGYPEDPTGWTVNLTLVDALRHCVERLKRAGCWAGNCMGFDDRVEKKMRLLPLASDLPGAESRYLTNDQEMTQIC